MNIQELYKLYIQSYSISTDTRKIHQDSIFFALKGENFNGNQFAEEALQKGASYAIVDEKKYQTKPTIILVDDVLKTLQDLATYHREKLNVPVIGLTGSNGKTTTKELMNAVLSTKYNTTATLGNLNNHIGVPLTLLSMTPETEMGIVEMGANHLREIDFLCSIALPDFGYITNFGKAHLEGFGSLKGVVQGKTELYSSLKERGKLVFVNANDSKQLESAEGIRQVTFGSNNADVIVELIEANPFVIVKFNSVTVQTKLIGAYNFDNIAAAIAIGMHFQVNDNVIKEAIENYIPTNNRSQIIKKGTNTIILDAYNANPTSMEAALKNISGLTDKNKIAILGDMFELGDDALKEHQNIAELVLNLNIDTVYLIGENFYKTTVQDNKIKRYKTFGDFKEYFSELQTLESTLLIKGSRGMVLERVLELL